MIRVAATLVSAHPPTLRIYEDEGLICPARTPTNIRLYSESDIRRITWIRHLTRERGVNLAGIRILFEETFEWILLLPATPRNENSQRQDGRNPAHERPS